MRYTEIRDALEQERKSEDARLADIARNRPDFATSFCYLRNSKQVLMTKDSNIANRLRRLNNEQVGEEEDEEEEDD